MIIVSLRDFPLSWDVTQAKERENRIRGAKFIYLAILISSGFLNLPLCLLSFEVSTYYLQI